VSHCNQGRAGRRGRAAARGGTAPAVALPSRPPEHPPASGARAPGQRSAPNSGRCRVLLLLQVVIVEGGRHSAPGAHRLRQNVNGGGGSQPRCKAGAGGAGAARATC
jgi:hypothetical protein